MKKYLLGLILAVLVVIPVTGKAASIAELQALIAQLTAQLKALQEKQTVCPQISKDLMIGSRGQEVSALQQ